MITKGDIDVVTGAFLLLVASTDDRQQSALLKSSPFFSYIEENQNWNLILVQDISMHFKR